MELLKRAAAGAALAALCACSLTRADTPVGADPDQLLVYSVLRAGGDTVQVLVTRLGTDPVRPGSAGVSGARVELSGGGVRIRLAEAPGGFRPCTELLVGPAQAVIEPGCYAAVLPGGVRVGERYDLAIELPGGAAVHGGTTVPPPPALLRPVEGTHVPFAWSGFLGDAGPVRVAWERPESGVLMLGARAGRLWRGGVAASPGQCQVILVTTDFTGLVGFPVEAPGDSMTARAILQGCEAGSLGTSSPPPDSVEAFVDATAADSAFARYARVSSDGVAQSRASFGITGAYGVFGSATRTARRVVLVPAPP